MFLAVLLLSACIAWGADDDKIKILLTGLGSNNTKIAQDLLVNSQFLKQEKIQFDIEVVDSDSSSSFTAANWNKLVATINKLYASARAFVIVHGPSNIEYTTSFLSFHFDNLTKTIAVTTFIKDPTTLFMDFDLNVLGAINLANQAPNVREVLFCMSNKIYRGNRIVGMDAESLESSFSSPNFQILGTVDASVNIYTDRLILPLFGTDEETDKIIYSPYDSNATDSVTEILFYPGMQVNLFKNSLMTEIKSNEECNRSVCGAILLAFGVGNGPSTAQDIINVLSEANKLGIVLVDASQCYNGRVDMGTYDTGGVMREVGCIGSANMTPAAAYTKLIYLISTNRGNGRNSGCPCDFDVEEVKKLMQIPLRGEFDP